MPIFTNSKLLCVVFISLVFSCSSLAKYQKKLSYGGFVSQGLLYTTDNTFFDDEDKFSAKMTELAIQANYQVNNNFRLSGQTIYRSWGKTESLLVDYLMLDYQVALSNSYNLGLRLGRIKSDLGLVNTTRDIPNARPSIFLPQSVYQDILRDTTTSYDGISLYGNQPLYEGRLSWSIAYGKYPSSSNLNDSILAGDFQATLTPEANIQLMATWESPMADWLISVGFENPNTLLNGNESAPVFTISDGNIKYQRSLVSTQYFSEFWDFTFEYINQKNTLTGFHVKYLGTLLPQSDQTEYTSDGFYGQWRYILQENLTLLLRYGRFASDKTDRLGEGYSKGTGYLKPAHLRYHHDFTLGIKWQLTKQWLFHTEAHIIEGTSAISPIVKLDHSMDNTESWQLYTAQISYSF